MTIIVLPAYNEEQSLPALFRSIRRSLDQAEGGYRVVLVNDGSEDRTGEVARAFAEELPLTVVDHESNRGLGAALRTGLETALTEADDDDAIITLDADNTHDPDLIAQMLGALRNQELDLVIASRFAHGGQEVGLATRRKIMSRGASFLMRLFFPVQGARDYTCGFRAYRAGTLRRGFQHYAGDLIQETGFACMAEVLVKLARSGARIGEVPMALRYDLKAGESKMQTWKAIKRYLYLLTHRRRLLSP
ncbi:MAG: glycosyltransferase [Armatimonadota bacterium]